MPDAPGVLDQMVERLAWNVQALRDEVKAKRMRRGNVGGVANNLERIQTELHRVSEAMKSAR